jgi:hypothetical protein
MLGKQLGRIDRTPRHRPSCSVSVRHPHERTARCAAEERRRCNISSIARFNVGVRRRRRPGSDAARRDRPSSQTSASPGRNSSTGLLSVCRPHLMERRPDITFVECTFVAANAQIGVARGAFCPRLALSAPGSAPPKLPIVTAANSQQTVMTAFQQAENGLAPLRVLESEAEAQGHRRRRSTSPRSEACRLLSVLACRLNLPNRTE